MVAMPRKMVTVSGCCCFSLITGSKILGWLGMLVSFSSIVITVSLLLSDTDQIMEELFEEYKHYYEIQEMLEYYYNHKSLLASMLIVTIAIASLNLIASCSLVIGVHKLNTNFIVPYLVISVVVNIMDIALAVLGSIYFTVMIIFWGLITIGFQVYFWICVYSLLMRMKKELKLMAKSQQYQSNLEYLPRPAEPAISQPACNIRVSQVPMRQPDNFNFPSVPVVFPGLGFGMANSMQKMFKM